MGGGVGGEVLRVVTGAAQLGVRAAAPSICRAAGAVVAAAISDTLGQWVPAWHGRVPQSGQGSAGWQAGAVPWDDGTE